jgi:hypothetical protein
MVDLTSEMAQLWASLGAPRPGRGRVIQFVSAASGEGTSTIAREFARFATGRVARPVWLIDLDLLSEGQAGGVAADPRRFGSLGKPTAATPDGSVFFTVQPPLRDSQQRPAPDARYLYAQPAMGGKLWVTRFRRDRIRTGQQVHLLPTGDYWAALRRHADLVVLDAPSADRSSACLTTAPFVDCSVLVVSADQPDTTAPAALRDAIMGAGGRCAGVVFNRAEVEPPPFLKVAQP